MTKLNCSCISRPDKEYWSRALDIAQNFYEDDMLKMTRTNPYKDISLSKERLKNVIDLGNNIRDTPNCKKEKIAIDVCFNDLEKDTINRVSQIIEYYHRKLGISHLSHLKISGRPQQR
jgi:hypothetical protein